MSGPFGEGETNAASFETMASQIAEGAIPDETVFNLFLKLGVQHWDILAKDPISFFRTDFGRLRDRYAIALNGDYEAKTAFCQEERDYLRREASQLAEMGQKEASATLRRRADNWQTVPMNFALNGR